MKRWAWVALLFSGLANAASGGSAATLSFYDSPGMGARLSLDGWVAENLFHLMEPPDSRFDSLVGEDVQCARIIEVNPVNNHRRYIYSCEARLTETAQATLNQIKRRTSETLPAVTLPVSFDLDLTASSWLKAMKFKIWKLPVGDSKLMQRWESSRFAGKHLKCEKNKDGETLNCLLTLDERGRALALKP